MRIGWLVAVFAAVLSMGAAAVRGESPDRKFYVFLCFGQSNSEGYPGLEEPDKVGVDERFRMLAAVDFPKMGRKAGEWYVAVPPLCRPSNGIGPGDYFGRTV